MRFSTITLPITVKENCVSLHSPELPWARRWTSIPLYYAWVINSGISPSKTYRNRSLHTLKMISRGQRVQKEGAGNKDIFLLKREATFSKKRLGTNRSYGWHNWFCDLSLLLSSLNFNWYHYRHVCCGLFSVPQENLIKWPRMVLQSLEPLSSDVRLRDSINRYPFNRI